MMVQVTKTFSTVAQSTLLSLYTYVQYDGIQGMKKQLLVCVPCLMGNAMEDEEDQFVLQGEEGGGPRLFLLLLLLLLLFLVCRGWHSLQETGDG